MNFTDTESERRVLSTMMHNETACIETLDTLTDNDFTTSFHRDLFLLIQSLYIRNIRPTYVEILKEGDKLGFVKGMETLDALKYIADNYIDTENLHYWLNEVKNATKGRATVELLKKYTYAVNKDNLNITDLITNMGSEVYNLAVESSTEKIDTPQEIADLGVALLLERVEKYRRMQEDAKLLGEVPLEGVPTGINSLDRMTLGLKPGDLAILGAQTGHGKTAFALNVAKASALDFGANILYVNTEMSRQQIARRWGAILSEVALSQIQAGSVTDIQRETVVQAYNRLARSGFYPISMPNLTPAKLEILARKGKMQHDIRLLILDYVGRMDKITADMQEWQVLEQILKGTKILAQTLEIAVLVLVQLNPDGTLQGAKRMENECDLMLKLLPVSEEGKGKMEEAMGKRFTDFNYRVFINKARDTESGINIPISFNKTVQIMREAEEMPDGVTAMSRYYGTREG